MIYWVGLGMLMAGADGLILLLSPEGLGRSGSVYPSKSKLGSSGGCGVGESQRCGMNPDLLLVGPLEHQEDPSWALGDALPPITSFHSHRLLHGESITAGARDG